MLCLLKYHLRSVFIRWRSTLATILGIALVVAVFVMIQALATGLEKSSGNTGDPRNILVVRKGAMSEATSVVTREQLNIIRFLPGVARDAQGQPLVSADLLIIINIDRVNNGGKANVLVRGTSAHGPSLRPQVSLVAGRWFTPGKRECVVSRRIAARFANLGIGERIRASGREFTVVGHFDGARSAFDSEMWVDAEEAKDVFDREDYCSVLVRASSPDLAPTLTAALEGERRLKMKAVGEVEYYREQTRAAGPIKAMGFALAVIMSVGAAFAAMNTLYASISSRTREIGTLRVLGYRRRSILGGFLFEGAVLCGIGGVLGCLLALPMHGYSTGTLSYESFAETVFDFQITPALALQGVVFSLVVGIVGSLFPALRAARLPVIVSLKSV